MYIKKNIDFFLNEMFEENMFPYSHHNVLTPPKYILPTLKFQAKKSSYFSRISQSKFMRSSS